MGGNVFPGLNRRYSRMEYQIVEDFLSDSVFSSLFEKFQICPYLPEKETFGDMDVICVPYTSLTEERLKDWFKTNYVKRNGNTWSLLYDELQVDLIVSNHQEYGFCCNYHGMYDRGNFIGKIAHILGLKFGHDGLWLPVRTSDDHKLGDILLTRDPRVAEDFLDIKPLVNALSFEDIFDNIVASKYFNPEVFLLENNNAVARVRDRKRPSYHKFLHMCQTLAPRQWFPRTEDKSVHLQTIFAAFPNAFKEYRILWARKEKIDTVREKFNGHLVSEWTGLMNKELGEYMVLLKTLLTDDEILGMTKEQLREFVLANR